jgi:glycosyltransferase involved in cell wall biosynthesis
VDEWVESISTLADDPGLREKMARKAKVVVREKYSLPVVGPQYEVLLEQYMNGSGDASVA